MMPTLTIFGNAGDYDISIHVRLHRKSEVDDDVCLPVCELKSHQNIYYIFENVDKCHIDQK